MFISGLWQFSEFKMLRVQVQLQTEFCEVEIIYLYNVQLEA